MNSAMLRLCSTSRAWAPWTPTTPISAKMNNVFRTGPPRQSSGASFHTAHDTASQGLWEQVCERERSRTTSALASAAAFVLEGELQLGAVGRDLALLDDQVLLEDLGDAQVAQRLGRPIHRRLRRQLPGLAAGAYELDHLVDAVRHGYLPRHGFTVSSSAGSGGGAAAVA